MLCVTLWPFVKSARLLLAEGHPAATVIEIWRPNADEWAMRGRRGVVAATVIDGETGSRCAKNGSPARDLEQGGRGRAAAGLRTSSGRFWRAPRASAGNGRCGGGDEKKALLARYCRPKCGRV